MLKRKSHFMNSALSIPQTFSFVLDSFLEIALCLFLPHLSTLTVRNEFTELLFNTCLRYIKSPQYSKLLEEIKKPLWAQLGNGTLLFWQKIAMSAQGKKLFFYSTCPLDE